MAKKKFGQGLVTGPSLLFCTASEGSGLGRRLLEMLIVKSLMIECMHASSNILCMSHLSVSHIVFYAVPIVIVILHTGISLILL